MKVIERRRTGGVKGRLSVKVSRDQLMSWVENFVDDFNDKETAGVTNIIFPCLTKVGQKFFVDDTKPFETWLSSLKRTLSISLYWWRIWLLNYDCIIKSVNYRELVKIIIVPVFVILSFSGQFQAVKYDNGLHIHFMRRY